jgi:hypothetical protein
VRNQPAVDPQRGTRRGRLPKPVVRALAYLGGAMSFAVPSAILGHAPWPATPAGSQASQRPVIELHKVIRRIVIDPPSAPAVTSAPQVRYVYVGGGGGGSPASTHCSTCP